MANPYGHIVHGQSSHPLYGVWESMKQRCYNPKTRGYRWYGAKGIRVCEEWQAFPSFFEWAMTHGYQEGLTLDRIDSEKNYEPDNCRWITMSEQQSNRSDTRKLTLNGVSRTLTEWSKLTGRSRTTIRHRLLLGYTVEEALSPQRRTRS